ncbi:CATIN-like protein [Mya arenaria]|uniref:Splicing factor Cactin n=1 Tax=Mya arenaria TaxID=6604 RepID=A0ABY7G2M2_MYAAR|nr:CATIN-like protein [Mya arenaria]
MKLKVIFLRKRFVTLSVKQHKPEVLRIANLGKGRDMDSDSSGVCLKHKHSRSRYDSDEDRRHKKKKKHRSRSPRERKKYRGSSDSDDSYSRERSRSSKDKKKRRHRTSDSDDSNSRDRSQSSGSKKKKKKKRQQSSDSSPDSDDSRDQGRTSGNVEKQKDEARLRKSYLKAGYTNGDNPFGDEHLTETFVWSKKISKEGNESLDRNEIHQMTKKKMEETRLELEKVKKRRLEREREREERDNERFHLQQAKLRSEIRIQDGRAKPIDLLAKYISAEDDELAIEMHEPYTYLYGLTITDLEDLLEDIKVYLELEQGKNTEYWRDIVTVTEDELQKLRKLENARDFSNRRQGINEAVNEEVVSVFKGKSTKQLLLLEDQMKKKLQGGEGVDQGIESSGLFPAGMKREGTPNSGRATPTSGRGTPTKRREATEGSGRLLEQLELTQGMKLRQADGEEDSEDEPILTEEDLIEDQSVLDYRAGSYSPVLIRPADIDDLEAVIYDPTDDMKKLALARIQVRSTGRVRLDQETEMIEKAKEGMDDEEAQFSVQHELEKQSFLWSDKYRPRKPRFFNRVHTGFEWNKYNQTHYDIDNPPPKIVQGYKFNIFYPDLIDKSRTPEYTVTPIPENPDFAILRFHAGPPYEFANNIMQLWFHFKRERYRR